jgi:osmotically-inducible protein OsmY
MFPTQIPGINPDVFSRCEERKQMANNGKSLPIRQNDGVIKEAIYQALWRDSVLRAIEYYEIDVHVRNETVYLYGHIVGTTSQLRIMNAIRTVPNILGIKNHLVLDDKLTLEIAASLGRLEHTHDCKFFTGASHGVVSLNGIVGDQNVKTLAERRAASNPNVRCIINNVRIVGVEPEAQDQPFLQPAIGEAIYFSDGISGVVRQVIINPDNRRVIAMVVQGNFGEPRKVPHSPPDGRTTSPEQFIVVSMRTVRYLTKASGFLHIKSNERDQYQGFDPVAFYTPNWDWTPPYPYCPEDVLFPAEYLVTEIQITRDREYPRLRIATDLEEARLREQLLANDSLGG